MEYDGGGGPRVPRNFYDALYPFEEDRRRLNRRAFCLGLAFICVYTLTFAVFNHPLNILTARFPWYVADFVRTVIPSAAGTGLCALSWPMFPRERRMMSAAFRTLTRLTVIMFVMLQVLLWGEYDAQWQITDFFARFVLVPLAMGEGVSLWLFYRHWKRLLERNIRP